MEKTRERERERVRETERGTGSQVYRPKENNRGMKDRETEAGKSKDRQGPGRGGGCREDREEPGRRRRGTHAQGPDTHRSSRFWHHLEKHTVQTLLSLHLIFSPLPLL